MKSLVDGDFQITRWDFDGSDVVDPEAAFKAIVLMCINIVRGTDATLRNEVYYNPDGKSAPGYFSDITLLPTDETKPGIILELKNVTVAALYPRKEDWTTKIITAKRELPEKSEKDLLNMPSTMRTGGKLARPSKMYAMRPWNKLRVTVRRLWLSITERADTWHG